MNEQYTHFILLYLYIYIYCFCSQDDVSTEALKCLYGTSRTNEIEDVVNNVSMKETTTVSLDDDASKRDKDKTSEEQLFKAPKFKDIVNYVWDQMQKRKKGSNVKHRFVISNQVLQFHPQTYQEVSVDNLFF